MLPSSMAFTCCMSRMHGPIWGQIWWLFMRQQHVIEDHDVSNITCVYTCDSKYCSQKQCSITISTFYNVIITIVSNKMMSLAFKAPSIIVHWEINNVSCGKHVICGLHITARIMQPTTVMYCRCKTAKQFSFCFQERYTVLCSPLMS